MGLFNNKRVYCQTCQERIYDWGYVSDVGNVYHTYSKCVPKLINPDNRVEFKGKNEIQQEIKDGKIINYKKLEKLTR